MSHSYRKKIALSPLTSGLRLQTMRHRDFVVFAGGDGGIELCFCLLTVVSQALCALLRI